MKIANIGLRGIPAQYSGIERAVEEIGTRMAARGHEVTVYCMAGRYVVRPRSYRGVRLRYVPTLPSKNLEMLVYSFLAAISGSLGGYDVLHFHALGPSMMACIPRALRKKTVVTVQGLDWQRDKWGRLARAYLKLGEYASWRFAHETIVVSKSLQRHYRRRHSRDTRYIPNGIGHQNYAELDEAARRFGLQKAGYVVFVGRLSPEKNVHLLIKAFGGIPSPMRLAIVGGGGEPSYLKEIQRLAANDARVLLTGPLYGRILEELVSNAFLFVLPSSIEGLPVALLEALSLGVPALVSDIAENVEALRQGDFDRGFLCPAGDRDGLRCALAHLLAHPHEVERKRGLGQEALRREYDWDGIAEETLRVYERVTGGHLAQPRTPSSHTPGASPTVAFR